MSTEILTYKTLAESRESEFRDRGSRFLGYAFSVETLSEIKTNLHHLKEMHPKAVHHCYAYRLGWQGTQFRANDDGEPSGSAGKPILGQIDSLGLVNTLVVVVRYFGGTLLGVPGLINAYKTTSQLCLQQALCVEKDIELPYQLEFDYQQMNGVMRLLKQVDARIQQQDLQLFCLIQAGIPKRNLARFLQETSNIEHQVKTRKVD